jgi:hypothetical protein
MNKKEFEKEIRERDEKLKILEERQKIINEEKQEIIREQQEIEEKIINDFRERIKIDFNVKEEDFNKKISSIGKIVSPRVIKKYLSDFDNLDKEYFRMTIKNQETGRAGDIYIYNMKHEMIKKIERE